MSGLNDNEMDSMDVLGELLDESPPDVAPSSGGGGNRPQQDDFNEPINHQEPMQQYHQQQDDDDDDYDEDEEMYNRMDMQNDVEYENLTLKDKIIKEIKLPLVVLFLLIVSHAFKLDNLLYKYLPSKLVSFKYLKQFIVILSSSIYAGIYYIISKYVA